MNFQLFGISLNFLQFSIPFIYTLLSYLFSQNYYVDIHEFLTSRHCPGFINFQLLDISLASSVSNFSAFPSPHQCSRFQIFQLKFSFKKTGYPKNSLNNSTYFYPQIIPPLLQIVPISHSFSKYFSTNYIDKTYYSNYTRFLNKIFSLNIFFGYTVRRRHNIFRHYKLPLAEQMAQKIQTTESQHLTRLLHFITMHFVVRTGCFKQKSAFWSIIIPYKSHNSHYIR